MTLVGLAVQRAVAGDRNVGLFPGVDERRIVHAFRAFEAGIDQGQVVLRTVAEQQRGAVGEMQVGMAFEMDWTRQEYAAGHHHAPAAGGRAGIDGLANSLSGIFPAAFFGAEAGDVEIAKRKLRRADASQDGSLIGDRGSAPQARPERGKRRAQKDTAGNHGHLQGKWATPTLSNVPGTPLH